MKRRLLIGLATGALIAAMVPAPASANSGGGLTYADIDNEDCEIVYDGFNEEWTSTEAQLHVTVNQRWIIATCHYQLTDTELAGVGGPFDRAQVFRGFDCGVGFVDNGDDDELDEIEATSSHATLAPPARLSIVCKAPFPDQS